MQYFPIFLRLQDQPVLVVGAGAVASRKIDLLCRAGAKVLVVDPEAPHASIAARIDNGQVKYLAEAFRSDHLNGMRLVVAATSHQAVNADVAHHTELRNIPVNVVDDRELSRFIMPAIVDRSPVMVAVSSGGDAPVLTRRLREKLETVLPTRLGQLAQLAGKWRSAVKNKFADIDARRKFWEAFFDGSIAADVLAGRPQADAAVEHALQATGIESNTRATQGEVALVGAGPGDPGLLTLRALRVLQNADVVLYDRLVSDQVLQLARRDAEFINVGKAAGDAPVRQAQINALLVEHAKQGKRVVRLKGGDPFIFGRGGEELEALVQNKIRFEVVPGITAAIGCAAYAGIPLTHRDHSQTLTLVTGNFKDNDAHDLDWEILARPNQTIVFYMGLNRVAHIAKSLCDHGAPADRPVALIEQGTSIAQRVITATLANASERATAEQLKSPSLLIVGDVTRLHDVLHWFNSTQARDSLASSVLQA